MNQTHLEYYLSLYINTHMSQALKTRLNNLAAEVSTLRDAKQAALTVSGTDDTGS